MAIELEKIEFKDFQEPAVGAENLNQLQDNTQTALNTLDTNKQDKLTAGNNITIENGIISSSGGGSGSIIDSTNIEDKITNTYSARVIDEMFGTLAEYEITNLPQTTLVSKYSLTKINKTVTLVVEAIWTEAITKDAWNTIGVIPENLLLDFNLSTLGVIINAQDGTIIGYGRILIDTSGNLQVKPTVSRTGRTGIAFSITWNLKDETETTD